MLNLYLYAESEIKAIKESNFLFQIYASFLTLWKIDI